MQEDSGSVVADIHGCTCGLLVGGNGATDSSDVTYASSIRFIIHVLHANKTKFREWQQIGERQTRLPSFFAILLLHSITYLPVLDGDMGV
ncbi:hypothetical protein EV401DRAFT_2002339 [Pisolithus croceorrhizus]|nr:hypothetical protein EV401DRAFT_2002339 [Pisolithus croceorrhizus]